MDVAFLLLTLGLNVRFSVLPRIYFDVTEIYQRCWLEETGQRLENVEQTHLVITASGRLVLKKKIS